MNTTIRKITLRVCHLQPRWIMRYSDGSVDPDAVPIILVEISNGETSGFGEFIPLTLQRPPGTRGAPSFDEWRMLPTVCEHLIGKDVRLLRSLLPPTGDGYDYNPIVDSIDFAMHDLLGKLSGLPVWSLLGGRCQPWVWAMAVVHTDTPAGMVERAGDYYRMGGHQWLKLKPNCNLEADRETMVRIRNEIDPRIRFFIDPNYSFKGGPDELISYVNALADCGLAVCEDPLDVDFDTWRYMQERSKVKLMVDAKARTPHDVLNIVQKKAARAINIHANWASGFAPAIHKARIARLGGLDTLIGSTLYLGFGCAAYQTLASVIPDWHICEQTNAAEDITCIGVQREYPTIEGKIHISDQPGLGVEPDWPAIEEMTRDNVVLES